MAFEKVRCGTLLIAGMGGFFSTPFSLRLELAQTSFFHQTLSFICMIANHHSANPKSQQTVDVIIAWLAAEDTGARKKLQSLLADRDESFQDVKATIQRSFSPLPYLPSRTDILRAEQLDGMNASAEEEDSVLKDMLATLIEHL